MKRVIISALLAVVMIGRVSAQEQSLRDVFKQMPDSLMPYLSQNNRLDFIDFIESDMKAEVENQLGGTSEMVSLAEDSLSIRMNDSMTTDLLLLTLDAPVDTISQVVVLIETFRVDSVYGESSVRFFTKEWKPMQESLILNEAQKKRVALHTLQNIVKRDDELLN